MCLKVDEILIFQKQKGLFSIIRVAGWGEVEGWQTRLLQVAGVAFSALSKFQATEPITSKLNNYKFLIS